MDFAFDMTWLPYSADVRVRCATQRDHVFHLEMNYSQTQLDQLDRLTERWVADHLQKGKTSKKDKELVTLESYQTQNPRFIKSPRSGRQAGGLAQGLLQCLAVVAPQPRLGFVRVLAANH